MYMFEMLEAYWYQIQKHRTMNGLTALEPRWVEWHNSNQHTLQEWEHKFKSHALAIYPELREYVKELESNMVDRGAVMGGGGPYVDELNKTISQLRQEIRALEEEITVLAANQKKPRKKKDN